MSSKPHDNGDAFFDAVERAIQFGEKAEGLNPVEAFNTSADHVWNLLQDALSVYERRSYGTSVFLSISAMEETAKAELLSFRARGNDGDKPKGRDPLKSHRDKHLIAVRPTTFMGRLPEILGDDVCARLQTEAESGELNIVREQALYVHVTGNMVAAPASVISRDRAREILLLSIEVADDVLVDYTNHSMDLGREFDAAFGKIAAT